MRSWSGDWGMSFFNQNGRKRKIENIDNIYTYFLRSKNDELVFDNVRKYLSHSFYSCTKIRKNKNTVTIKQFETFILKTRLCLLILVN